MYAWKPAWNCIIVFYTELIKLILMLSNSTKEQEQFYNLIIEKMHL